MVQRAEGKDEEDDPHSRLRVGIIIQCKINTVYIQYSVYSLIYCIYSIYSMYIIIY